MRKRSLWQKIGIKLTTWALAIITILSLTKWFKKNNHFWLKDDKASLPNEEVIKPLYHHEHSFSDWQIQDDYVEKRICSCGYQETRDHLYNVSTYYVPDGENSHHILKTYICANCHNSFKLYEREKCDFLNNECSKCNYVIRENHFHNWQRYYYDADLEYFKCSSCGALKAEIHKLQIRENNGIITYTCRNNNCPYSYKENANHQHVYGLKKVDDYNYYFICSCGTELVIPKDLEINKDFERGIVLSRTKNIKN